MSPSKPKLNWSILNAYSSDMKWRKTYENLCKSKHSGSWTNLAFYFNDQLENWLIDGTTIIDYHEKVIMSPNV